jgi:S1-C subfamily serine protease
MESARAPAEEIVAVPRRSGRRRAAALGTVLAAALVITAVVFYRWGSAGPPEPVTARPTPTPTAPAPLSVAEVYATVAPSVVSIRAGRGAAPAGQGRREASGTGLIANADGAILTALHVVRDARSIQVTFADGTRSTASVTASDPAIDIAVLSVTNPPAVVVPAVLGGGVTVGDEVVAIGDQLGLVRSTTAGVVSGLDRSLPIDGADDIEGLIQFDAAVNPGSSGGPLLNTRGEAVGIVVALASPTEVPAFVGVGFAVPIGSAVGAGDGPPPQL